jgi:hypothetical protein
MGVSSPSDLPYSFHLILSFCMGFANFVLTGAAPICVFELLGNNVTTQQSYLFHTDISSTQELVPKRMIPKSLRCGDVHVSYGLIYRISKV